jgi:uncharacterized protein (DUF488 family)
VLTAAGEVLTERLRALPLQACLMYAERQASACHREVIAAYLAQRGNHSEHLTSGTSLHCQSNAPLHLLVWA